MRQIWNDNWKFTKNKEENAWENIELPHTWNGIDGQDGGNDYYRGTCYYKKNVTRSQLPDTKIIYMEFEGTNSSAELFVNGKSVAQHDGGYSTWRADITPYLQEENEILVAVDNAPNNRVYPQTADFTFYGGIYRDVAIIGVEEKHFDLDHLGGPAIKVTPEVHGADATLETEVYLTNATAEDQLIFTLIDDGKELEKLQVPANETLQKIEIKNVHLWNGRKDPHLYTVKAELVVNGKVVDERCVRTGVRTFEINPEKGFILNGESYPLRGVSRHQDRPKIGNALKKEHHEEDIDLIMELGATTVRLAHYQQAQYFYDLCDEKGLVVWAEIPYISQHMPTGRENTISQMKELVIQNYNHPSIVVWGISNEISMGGAGDPDLLNNHHILNDLCHELDKTRLTTMAVLTMCDINEEYVQIPDVVSYNHYYGWYGGDTSMNGPFFDRFHEKFPNKAIGMSEYGCEALNWHTSNPEQGDYTEEYQAYYHEELIKQLYTRPFIWATHVWNMFDFAADARAEGGEDGMNHKGLVTFDRKYKKDAFYAYKAWLSDEPFVHLCGKRYVDRVEEVTKVTVYSNQPEVELFVNGKSLGKKTSPEHFFYFDVPNAGESTIKVVAGDCTDEGTIRKVDVFNEEYRMKETGDVINWFEITAPEGYFSILDKIGEIVNCPEGAAFFGELMKAAASKMGNQDGNPAASMDMMSGPMMQMMGGFTVKRMLSMLGTAGMEALTKEQILGLNAKLNTIKKPQ